MKSGTPPPGGTKTGTPVEKEALKQLEKRVLKSNTMEANTLIHDEDYPLWRTLMMEQLTPFGLQEIVEDTFDSTTYQTDVAKDHLKCLRDNFAPILQKFLRTTKGKALVDEDNTKPDEVWKAHHEFQTDTTHADSLARAIFKDINNSSISDCNEA